jgi:hypothetical protein
MTRTELAEGIKAAMIDTGRAADKWRVEVTGCEQAGIDTNGGYYGGKYRQAVCLNEI